MPTSFPTPKTPKRHRIASAALELVIRQITRSHNNFYGIFSRPVESMQILVTFRADRTIARSFRPHPGASNLPASDATTSEREGAKYVPPQELFFRLTHQVVPPFFRVISLPSTSCLATHLHFYPRHSSASLPLLALLYHHGSTFLRCWFDPNSARRRGRRRTEPTSEERWLILWVDPSAREFWLTSRVGRTKSIHPRADFFFPSDHTGFSRPCPYSFAIRSGRRRTEARRLRHGQIRRS